MCTYCGGGEEVPHSNSKYGQKKKVRSSSLVLLSSKEEVDMDEPISHLPEKE